MLKFILGKSGTGKTEWIYQNIKEKISDADDKKVLIIVPEQYTYETERRVLNDFGVLSSLVNVSSFSKLASRVMNACGHTSSRHADDITKLLVVSMAVKEVADDLKTYSNQVESVSFYEDVLSVISEFEDELISSDELLKIADNVSGTVKEKLSDISLIYTAYEAILSNKGISLVSDISLATDLISDEFFSEYDTVYFDGFKSFTADELLMLEKLMGVFSEMYVSLCTLPEFVGKNTIFQTPSETYTTLISLCKKNTISFENTCVLEKALRFIDKSVEYLSGNIFKNKIVRYPEQNTGVQVIKAPDMNKECRYIAARIRQLVLEENYSYKDIAIVGRNISDYATPLELAFSTYDIPYFYNVEESVLKTSLALFITTAFDAVSFNTEKLISLAKTGFAGLSLEEASRLENYCYVWDIKNRLWLSDFTYRKHTDDEATEKQLISELETINILRKRLVTPLEKFSNVVKNGNGSEISKAVYRLMLDFDVKNTLGKEISRLIENHKEANARNLKQAYDRIIQVLDTMYKLLSIQPIGYKNYALIFKQILLKTTITAPPQYIDTVTIADASLMRLSNIKVVFLIGANEGKFPADSLSCSLLSAFERRSLSDCGLKLTYPDSKTFNEERFVAYEALSSASDKIYISYSLTDASYKEQYPSLLATQAVSAFLGCEVNTNEYNADFYCSTEKALFEYMTEKYIDDDENRATAIKSAELLPDISEKAEFIKNLKTRTEYSINNKELMSSLVGNDVYVSATRMEDYYNCKFYHFCKYGLNLRTLDTVELDAQLAGSILHYCLECILREHFDELPELKKSDITRIAKEIIDEYMNENYGGSEDKSSSYKNKLNRFSLRVSKIIEHLQKEFSQCEFVPVGFETEIGKGCEVEPEIIKSKDGKNIMLNGKIDRIDLYEFNGQKYIRVIDYKSSEKKMELSDILNGHNLQMILYLFILTSSDKSRFNGCVPAGAFYSSLAEIKVNSENDTNDKQDKTEAINNAYLKNFALKGLVLDDKDVLEAMDKDGTFISVSKDMIADLEEMSLLKAYCEKMIKNMVDEFMIGDISAKPFKARGSQYTKCKYCEYFDICGKEGKAVPKNGEPVKKNDFYDMQRSEGV